MYCFKIFYTLKLSAHIKINFKITPTCFGPIERSSGITSFLSQSYHDVLLDDGPMGPKHVGVFLKLILICVEGFKV